MELNTTKNKLEKHILFTQSEDPEIAHYRLTKRKQSSKISKVVESIKNNVDNGFKI